MNQPINQIKDINKQFTKGTHLFNGILKDKFKFKYNPINDGVLKEIANKYKKGDKRPSYDDYEPDPACIPMPTDLLRHELDKDDMMMDTIIDLCDSDGIPLRWRYLCDDFDDVREMLEAEDFFDVFPNSEEMRYFVARDWVGCPIKKYEIDAIEKKRKIYERRAIKKKQEYLKRRVKAKKLHEESKKIKIKNEKTVLTW
jgi:hypothetical protein|tara:strand:+ start:87 stop:683 length:597 start_codon:yes stop_codon:yes gene_type:complete